MSKTTHPSLQLELEVIISQLGYLGIIDGLLELCQLDRW